jgi:serine/threonine protein kinase
MRPGDLLAESESAARLQPCGQIYARSRRSSRGIGPGSYSLDLLLHQSAVAATWSAFGPTGDRYVLKLAGGDANSNAAARRYLAQEYQLNSSLSHPRIRAPLAWVEDASASAIVFEYLGGGDLVSLTGSPPAHWAGPMIELAEALRYLHGQGYVHRDIKARNVMFDDAGRSALIDFASCARSGTAWQLAGISAGYQRRGHHETIEHDDDLYCFAVLLYELLTGTLPVIGSQLDSALDQYAALRRSKLTSLVVEILQAAAVNAEEKLHEVSVALEDYLQD